MNGLQWLLLFLISTTFQTSPIKCVTRFKVNSCVKTRNVTFVVTFKSPLFSWSFYNEEQTFQYGELRKYIENLNRGHPCISMSSIYVSSDEIYKITDLNDEKALVPYKDIVERRNFDHLNVTRCIEFLEGYEKVVGDSQDKMLIVYNVFSYSISLPLIRKLNELRKFTTVILIMKRHQLYYRVFLQVPFPFPHDQIIYFPDWRIKNRDQMYQYLMPALELIQNPDFDRFKFIAETPYEKNISCLRNKTVVWATKPLFFADADDSEFQLILFYEYFLALSKKLNLKFYTLSPSVNKHFARSKPPPGELLYIKNTSILIYKDEFLSDVLKLDSNSIVPSNHISYCKNGLVYILDTSSYDAYRDVVPADKNKCFVHIKWTDNDSKGYPYIIQNMIYFSNKDVNSVAGSLNLLIDALIDIGC